MPDIDALAGRIVDHPDYYMTAKPGLTLQVEGGETLEVIIQRRVDVQRDDTVRVGAEIAETGESVQLYFLPDDDDKNMRLIGDPGKYTLEVRHREEGTALVTELVDIDA